MGNVLIIVRILHLICIMMHRIEHAIYATYHVNSVMALLNQTAFLAMKTKFLYI